MTANTIDTMIYSSTSLITTSISMPVTLGAGGYGMDLTITSTGIINDANLSFNDLSIGADGVSSEYPGGFVLNDGTIAAGLGLQIAGTGILLLGGNTLINHGEILGGYGTMGYGGSGVYISPLAGSSLTNTGTIVGGNGGVDGGNGVENGLRDLPVRGAPGAQIGADLTNDGTIFGGDGFGFSTFGSGGNYYLHGGYGGTGVILYNGGAFLNNGVISGGTGIRYGGDGVFLTNRAATTLINAGSITGGIGPGGTLGAAVYVQRGGTFATTIIAEPGAVFTGGVYANAYAPDSLILAGTTAGSLNMSNTFSGFSTIDFGSGSSWTLEGASIALAAGQTISGFAQGDTIVLDNFAATSQTLGPDGLTLSNATTTETLDITGISQFTITDNADGGTDITTYVACFLRGTRIATPRGQIPVEKLTIGDLVKTMHGPQPIRWIGTRAYAARFIANNPNALPIRIRRHAIAPNIPSRDLYVSPDHAIAEGGVLIHAHLLQNGVSITQPETTADIEYFHLEFDTHTILFAENLPTESFIDEHARHRFQNAHTAPATAPQKPCLPRMAEGFHLQNIKSRIAARAGIRPPTTLGALRGALDECTPTLIRGWAQNTAAPETPVTLEITSGAYTRTIPANTHRPDLRLAGLGSGCHGFSLTLPNLQNPITLRRLPDGATLPDVGRISEASSAIFPRQKNKRSLF